MSNPLQSSARTAADSARIARTLASFEVRVQLVWNFHHPALSARNPQRTPNDIVKAFRDFATQIGVPFFSPSRRIGFPAAVLTGDDVDWASRGDFASELYQELANEGVTWRSVCDLAYRLAVGTVYVWDEYEGAHHDSYRQGDGSISSGAAMRGWREGQIRRQAGEDRHENLLSLRERSDLGRAQARAEKFRRNRRRGHARREHDHF